MIDKEIIEFFKAATSGEDKALSNAAIMEQAVWSGNKWKDAVMTIMPVTEETLARVNPRARIVKKKFYAYIFLE